MVVAQVMTDQQIIQFAKDEAKAGTSQSQIVTKLMQRGVKIDQIRRLRNQYGGTDSTAIGFICYNAYRRITFAQAHSKQ